MCIRDSYNITHMRMNLRRTKIVCTIGPASQDKDILRQIIISGMNVARLNFSHGNNDEHADRIKTIRELELEIGKPIAILQDLPGPKIRTCLLYTSNIALFIGRHRLKDFLVIL